MNLLVWKSACKGLVLGIVFSKACQYDIAKEKVYKNMKYVSIEFIQTNLQKCINWLKKFEKGK